MLDQIIQSKRIELNDFPDVDADTLSPSARDFRIALTGPELSVIAEVKRRAPSAGLLADKLDPIEQANRYVAGGAHAISVLVDRKYFNGSWEDLTAVAANVPVPVLCKEFILDPRQIRRARAAGADACLLIVAALTDDELRRLRSEVTRWNMTPLVEVHDADELDRALECGAELIGVNNRNLQTMNVDRQTVDRLAARVPDGCTLVAESGYRSANDLIALPRRGDAVLIGTALMRAADPAAELRQWLSFVQQHRPGAAPNGERQ